MIRISDAVEKIIAENNLLEFGFSQGIFNLTQLAKFIKPLVEVRTQKEIQVPAIVMNLSRLQRKSEKKNPPITKFKLKNIDIYSSLATITFYKDAGIHDHVNEIFEKVRAQKGYFALSESSQEVTIFFQRNFLDEITKSVKEESIKYKNIEVTCVRVRFAEEYFHIPGLLYFLMQKIYLQGINIIEISSTYTEFCIYLRHEDVKVAFETLHDSFL